MKTHNRRRRPSPGTRPRVPAVSRPSRAAPVGAQKGLGPASRAVEVPTPSPQAAPPKADAIQSGRALVCKAPASLTFDDYDGTAMFDTLAKVMAVPVEEASSAVVCRSIAEARGYDRDALFGLAEVGYHYFRSGGFRLAEVIFEGLTAIDPNEPYFWLALGLVADYLDDKTRARVCYGRVSKLDPEDPRPDLNLAELELERGDRRAAVTRLRWGYAKAVRSGETALANKAAALLELNGQAA